MAMTRMFPLVNGLHCWSGFGLMLWLACNAISVSAQSSWSGKFSAELRAFTQDALDTSQSNEDFALAAEPRWLLQWRDGRSKVAIKAFGRWDARDKDRSHFDLREAEWVHVGDHFELRSGVRKVFWGVTESQHLVDIINQTDFVENVDGEDKLGQPMVNVALANAAGNWDFFVLPGFRARTFPGPSGRLRIQTQVLNDREYYAADEAERHIDWAIRWFKIIAGWDIGISHFNGTSRDPLFVVEQADQEIVLVPYYEQIRQTGLDIQTVQGNWLWKGEFISRQGRRQQYFAATAGYEYSFYGIWGQADLGLVNEYLYNDDGAKALSPFQNDIMLGVRMSFNDTLSKEILLGVITDMERSSQLWTFEANQRITNHWKISLKANVLRKLDAAEPLYDLRRDDFVQLELAYYF